MSRRRSVKQSRRVNPTIAGRRALRASDQVGKLYKDIDVVHKATSKDPEFRLGNKALLEALQSMADAMDYLDRATTFFKNLP